MNTATEFWSRIHKGDVCWNWTGAKGHGYGNCWWQGRYERAHRIAWELLVGPIPAGQQLDHLCRNRACVNPDHLELVTRRENILRGEGASARNARKTHCQNGHPLSGDNVRFARNGARICRICNRAWRRAAYHQREKATNV